VRALVALLAATLLVALAWALITPAFQAPDENSHFGYVQSLVDGPGLPGDPGRPIFSTEQVLALNDSNADQAAAQPLVKMEWSSAAAARWRAREAALPPGARSDGGGPNPAASNPPLYYLVEAAAYDAAGSGNLFDRLLAMRVVSLLWLLVTVTAVWLLAGELTGRDRILQLAAGSVAGLAPMMSFISASVTPDAALYALWSVVLWLGVRILKRGATPWSALALFVAAGAACCVKATSYALLPAVVVALAVALRRARPRMSAGVVTAGAAALGIVATLGVWIVVAHVLDRPASAQLGAATSSSGFNLRFLLSYLWQFYLPRLPFETDFTFLAPHLALYDIWMKGAWGSFGWLEVDLPGAVYLILSGLTALVVVGAGVALWRTRGRADRAVGAFLALAAIVLLAGLHWTEFRQIQGGGGTFNQGRYLLPLVGIAAVLLTLALRALRPRWRPPAVAAVVGGLFALQVLSLGLMLGRFYA
jgi:4-amino-4-deoxy-L-arabinose transferase-like glycosyltransferase